MRKFRVKPRELEAEQWFPGRHVEGVEHWDITEGSTGEPNSTAFVVSAHGQHVRISPGDYVIKEHDGDHHYYAVCRKHVFEASHDPIKDDREDGKPKYAVGDRVQWDGTGVSGGAPQVVTIDDVSDGEEYGRPEGSVVYSFKWRWSRGRGGDRLESANNVPEEALTPLAHPGS